MVESLGGIVRFFNLACSALLAGSLAFSLVVALPAFQRAGENLSGYARHAGFHLKLGQVGLLGIFLSSIASLWLQIVTVIGGSPLYSLDRDTFAQFLTGTQFGLVWLIRLLSMLLLAATFLFLQREKGSRNRQRLLPVAVFLAGAIAAAPAFSSHSAAGEGLTLFLYLFADVLHILASSFWLGGLLPLAVLLRWSQNSIETSDAVVAQEAIRRFSILGLMCVTIIVATGLLNSWNLVGGIAPLFGTAYGKLLLAKLALLLPLLGVAAINLARLKPRILLSKADGLGGEFLDLIRRLRRNVGLEIGLGVLILFIVAIMGITPPARHIQPSWPFTFRWSLNAIYGLSKPQSQVQVGSHLAVAGLLILAYGALRRRHRPFHLGIGLTGIAYGALVTLPPLSIDAYPTTYRRPSVPYHAISIANGLLLYREACVTCHGVSGYGDGPAAEGLKPKPADLTAKHTADHTAGDLFWWLTHGKAATAMPGFMDSLSEEERWDLINFARALSSGEQSRPMAPLVEPDPWMVAPDFAFRTAKVEGKSLKEYRGQKIVLIVLFSFPHSKQRLQQLEMAYGKLVDSGVEVLAIPIESSIIKESARFIRSLPVVTDGSREIFLAYSLFRRSFSQEGTLPDPPIPPHMEFLIDRQGYIRARWISWDGPGWTNFDRFLKNIDRLNKEKPSAPASDEHVH